MIAGREGGVKHGADRDKASELPTEPSEGCPRIGMPKHVGMAEALLGEV